MSAITISLSVEQFTEIIKAYRTIQEFLETVVSPSELYQQEFLAGLKESDEDIRLKKMNEVRSFEDFMHKRSLQMTNRFSLDLKFLPIEVARDAYVVATELRDNVFQSDLDVRTLVGFKGYFRVVVNQSRGIETSFSVALPIAFSRR